MRVHSLRSSEMPSPGQPMDQGELLEEAASANHQKGNSSHVSWISFPPSIYWCLQEHTICWVPFSARWPLQHTSSAFRKWQSGFPTGYSYIERPTSHFATHWQLSQEYPDILRVLWVFPSSPHIFPGLLSSFSFLTPEFGPSQKDTDVLHWCSIFAKWEAKVFPFRKQSRGSSRRKTSTLGMLWEGPGIDFLLQTFLFGSLKLGLTSWELHGKEDVKQLLPSIP